METAAACRTKGGVIMAEDVSYTFSRPDCFDLNQIFDCGQCFRFERIGGEDGVSRYEGIACGKFLRLTQTDASVTLHGTDAAGFEEIWRHYFALDERYDLIRLTLRQSRPDDAVLAAAMERGRGIRILRQEPWETICSFILSQNNNIPRIRRLISSLSESFGMPIDCGDGIRYAFPTAEALAEAGESAIFACRTGFRAGYLYDAARRAVSGELPLRFDDDLPTRSLLQTLMSVRGIGPKVASCIALFGFGRTDAFPVDVWMKRALARHYPDGFDPGTLGRHAGIAQQYLFYYERYGG